MAIKQVSVFLSDEPGMLSDLTGVLADNDINIHAFSVAEGRDYGIVRLITESTTETVSVLEGAGYVCSLTDVIAVAVREEVGSMHKLLQEVADAGINLNYSYAFTTHDGAGAYMVARVEDPAKAEEALRERGIATLGESAVANL